MNALELVVVSAGLREPSNTRLLADRLAEAGVRALAEHGRAVHVRVVELRELAVDVADYLVTGYPGGALADAIRAVEDADGLIAVSPIFSASFSGLFKSFFDVLDNKALTGKPVLIAATGGTPRHCLALDHAMRPLFSYLRAIVMPTAVFAATEDWGSVTAASSLAERIDRAGAELAAVLAGRPGAGRADRAGAEPTGLDGSVLPFEQLLAG